MPGIQLLAFVNFIVYANIQFYTEVTFSLWTKTVNQKKRSFGILYYEFLTFNCSLKSINSRKQV